MAIARNKKTTSVDKDNLDNPEKFLRVCDKCSWFTTNQFEEVVYCGVKGPLCPRCYSPTTVM